MTAESSQVVLVKRKVKEAPMKNRLVIRRLFAEIFGG